MKEFVIGKCHAGKRLDYFMTHEVRWPKSLVMKAWRTKKLKVNGKREPLSYELCVDDHVVSYILEKKRFHFSVVYEDDNLIVVDKEAGILCMDSTGETQHTLFDEVNEYLREKGENNGYMVHRIDFHTAGLMVIGKTLKVKEELDKIIKHREMEKIYHAVVLGHFSKNEGTLHHYLFKDAKANRVFLSENFVKGSKEATTDYKVLRYSDSLSLVECTLHTGRTHQIRSQLAFVGHPLLGDDKYGNKEINRKYKKRGQLLMSYRISFHVSQASILAYLNDKEFISTRMPFSNTYFSNRKNI